MEYLNAFLCGGILCTVGQIIIDKTQLTPARILTGYVVVGVLLSALGLYEPLAQWGGAGATVPLTGFGHTLAKGVREAVASDGWIGIFTGGLTAAAGGVTAAVVKYRLPNGHSEVPRNDADEALRVMREMAAELNIDPAKVGVSGTSAGGYLAGSVGTLSEVKPDFMILYYPVISADADKRHKGTFVQLLGADDADKPVAQEFSLEKKVDARTPPTLLFHCDDDKVVPAVNSALFYQKLKEHGVKATLHIYPSGGHGWGMNPKFRYYGDWQKATLDWLSTL